MLTYSFTAFTFVSDVWREWSKSTHRLLTSTVPSRRYCSLAVRSLFSSLFLRYSCSHSRSANGSSAYGPAIAPSSSGEQDGDLSGSKLVKFQHIAHAHEVMSSRPATSNTWSAFISRRPRRSVLFCEFHAQNLLSFNSTAFVILKKYISRRLHEIPAVVSFKCDC